MVVDKVSFDPFTTVTLFSFGDSASNVASPMFAVGRTGCAASDVVRTASSLERDVSLAARVSVVMPGRSPLRANETLPWESVVPSAAAAPEASVTLMPSSAAMLGASTRAVTSWFATGVPSA